MPWHRMSREGWLLLLVCTLDAVSSAWLFRANLAVEANPILRPFAEAGTLPFLSAKVLSYLPAILWAECYRQRRPWLVRSLLRGALILYVALYAWFVGTQCLRG